MQKVLFFFQRRLGIEHVREMNLDSVWGFRITATIIQLNLVHIGPFYRSTCSVFVTILGPFFPERGLGRSFCYREHGVLGNLAGYSVVLHFFGSKNIGKLKLGKSTSFVEYKWIQIS